jgi:hypothetical protein
MFSRVSRPWTAIGSFEAQRSARYHLKIRELCWLDFAQYSSDALVHSLTRWLESMAIEPLLTEFVR